jgi:hypothetical protein
MATVERLFNFDDQLLARQVAGQRDDYHMGQLAPGPWGLAAAGMNRIGRGLFNNNNELLQEKAIVEEALQLTNTQLKGDMSDPSKMYGELLKNLTTLGAKPESITKVADRKAMIDADTATNELNASIKALSLDAALQKQKDDKAFKNTKLRQVKQKEMSKVFESQIDTADKRGIHKKALELSEGDKDSISDFEVAVKQEASRLLDTEDGLTMNTGALIQKATENVSSKVKWDSGVWYKWNDEKWVEKTEGEVSVVPEVEADPELKALLERNRTK